MDVVPRRQRWASFSVRAHLDYRALASDLLLYDRIVVPYPDSDEERARWERQGWDPDHLDHVYVQSADLIVPVFWTQPMRHEFEDRMASLRSTAREVAYGETARLYSAWFTHSKSHLWDDVVAGLDPKTVPERRPHVVAGYQSEEEAFTAHDVLVPDSSAGNAPTPGTRAADVQVALAVEALLDELIAAPRADANDDARASEDLFLCAVDLSLDARFRRARTALYELEDRLYIDQWSEDEVACELADLESDYNAAVRARAKAVRKRRAVSLLPTAVGGALALGKLSGATLPVPNSLMTTPLRWVTGRFVDIDAGLDPADHPGAVFSMVRAAYRAELA